jgi:hypothetical protein
MTLRPALLPTCGRCGKKWEGLRHVCYTNSSRKATVSLKLSFGTCAKCKRTVANPLTHVCKPKSDFKRRKTAQAKAEKAAARKKRQAEKHDYQACSDQDCPKPLCVAFKAGDRRGYQRGFDDGFGAGFAAGSAAASGAA